MATQTITEPILLDSTGQDILSALEDIKDAVQPTNVYLDLPMSIQVSDWTQDGSTYSYTWTNQHVTEECAVEVFFGSGSSNITSSVISFEKVSGGVEFETTTLPSASLPVIVRIINAKADMVIDDIDATMVSTEAISGVTSVEQALANVDGRIGAVPSGQNLQSEVESLNSNINNLFLVEKVSISFGSTGVASVALKTGYWLIQATVYNGFGCTVGYSPNNTYYIHASNYADKTLDVYLTWVKITPPAS